MAAVLTIAELRDGNVREESFEVVTAARQLAEAHGHQLVTLVVGDGVGRQAENLAMRAGGRVLCADHAALADYSLSNYRAVARAAIEACDARFVLMSATPVGWDLAPALAAGLDAALITSVTSLLIHEGRPSFTRRVFGGKLETRVVSAAETTVLTLEPGACRAADAAAGSPVEPLAFELPASPGTRFVARRAGDPGDVDLTKADVIVSGGRGVGGAEKFAEVITPLAEALGAAVGASRPVVDAGWLPRAHQVGSSGQVVKPKVYIACGISGAVQHLAGMKNSQYIIAINRDTRAPIYQVADLGVVADLHEVAPALTEALNSRSKPIS